MTDVTVAVLTRNGGAELARLVEAVLSQRTDRSVELLLVDSGSTDGVPESAAGKGARVVTIEPATFNFGLTRDLAFEHARGDIVVSLSQDAIPAHDRWLENLLAPFADEHVAATCGRSIPDPVRAYPQFAWERNGWFYFTHEIQTFVRRYGRGLSNANSAIRKSVWDVLRFGEQSIGEDFRFQIKLHETSMTIAFPDDAAVLHHHNYTLGSLWKRARNEGMGLREMGCGYALTDWLRDALKPRLYVTWFKELVRGKLRSPAALLFPWVRPWAVYTGSRFGRTYLK